MSNPYWYRPLINTLLPASQWYAYVLDVLLGVYQVAQATIVMFIAIYVRHVQGRGRGRDRVGFGGLQLAAGAGLPVTAAEMRMKP